MGEGIVLGKYTFIIALAGISLQAHAETVTYTYDARGQLLTADTSTTAGLSANATYAYDRAGNRTVATSTDETGGLHPTFRFRGTTHFYTNSYAEGLNAGFTADGISFRSYGTPGTGRFPLYRCIAGSSDHFVSSSSTCEGQTVEYVFGYVCSSAGAGCPNTLYRFYNAAIGEHLITTNYSEGVAAGDTFEFVLGYVS
jgi:hypothetical protein